MTKNFCNECQHFWIGNEDSRCTYPGNDQPSGQWYSPGCLAFGYHPSQLNEYNDCLWYSPKKEKGETPKGGTP